MTLRTSCLIFVITALTIGPAATNAADPISGRASVIDGDTIEVHGTRIRLDGIDAPESWQTCLRADGRAYRCGTTAAIAMDEFLSRSRPVTCEETSRDRYGRTVAKCVRADGKDVNAWAVLSGNAVDWARYSNGRYATHQADAKSKRLGIWQGEFVLPCIARAEKRHTKPAC